MPWFSLSILYTPQTFDICPSNIQLITVTACTTHWSPPGLTLIWGICIIFTYLFKVFIHYVLSLWADKRSRNQMNPKESSKVGRHCQEGKEQGLSGQRGSKGGANWRDEMSTDLKGIRNTFSKCFLWRTRLSQTWSLKLGTEFRVTSCLGVSQIIFSATFSSWLWKFEKKKGANYDKRFVSQGIIIQRNTVFLCSWFDFCPSFTSTLPLLSLLKLDYQSLSELSQVVGLNPISSNFLLLVVGAKPSLRTVDWSRVLFTTRKAMHSNRSSHIIVALNIFLSRWWDAIGT